MAPQRLVVLVALIVSSLICLAQHRQARETGAAQNNSAPAHQASPAPDRSQAQHASPSPSSSSSSTSRVNSLPRGGDTQREQHPDRAPQRSAGREDDRSHPQPEPPAARDKAPSPAGNNQQPAGPEKPSGAQNVYLKKLAAECRKSGGILFNGVCVLSIPEAQGYWSRRDTSRAPTPCDNKVKQARIAALQAQLARACGPQGNATECDAAKKDLAQASSLPDCRM